MIKIIQWVQNNVVPVVNKITENPWVDGVAQSIMQCLPMVLVGSVITVFGVLGYFFPLPDLWSVSDYTFGLMSLFMAFLIPYNIMVNKKRNKVRFVAGCTGMALYIMTCMPVDTDYGSAFNWSKFGAGGLFSAIIVALFVAAVMNLFSKRSFFKEDSPMPSFVAGWIDSLLPILICMLLGWYVVLVQHIDVQSIISVILSPVVSIAQSYPGYLLLSFLPIAFYSMGISDWVFTPITNPITNWAIAENAALVAAGSSPRYVYCQGVSYHQMMGGTGCTWPLVIYCSLSKSEKFKTIGRISIVPAIFNINEPLIFGVVAFNPLLMIPMWLIALILPTVTYFTLSLGLATIPSNVFTMWYAPAFLNVYLLSGDIRNVLLAVVNFILAALIYYPFFKAAERQEIEKERAILQSESNE